MSCSSAFVFKGVSHRRFKFKKCSVWLPWGKINPLVYNIFWLYNFKVFDTIKSVTFRKSWGHILELYTKAQSSLISQHVQFFNKKCKKTYNFMVSLYWRGSIVSKLQSHNKETVFFLFLPPSPRCFWYLFDWPRKSESAWESSPQTSRPFLVKQW